MSNILELKNISKTFVEANTPLQVLTGASLNVKIGEKVAIVGASGSGKSTLLQIAGLLDSATTGDVIVAGEDAATLSDAKRSTLRGESLGFVYQYHHLLKEFSALENVMMPALAIGDKSKDIKERASNLLKRVGLAERESHFPSQLSGGEQQRVAIARALMNNPKLLLADEPTGNLDPHTADEISTLFEDLVQEHGMSILMVTHNEALAKFCDTVYCMEEGVLVKHER
jgi:lipoprotein-releasing system ATP-binding protein